jgi:hypothetical protein
MLDRRCSRTIRKCEEEENGGNEQTKRMQVKDALSYLSPFLSLSLSLSPFLHTQTYICFIVRRKWRFSKLYTITKIKSGEIYRSVNFFAHARALRPFPPLLFLLPVAMQSSPPDGWMDRRSDHLVCVKWDAPTAIPCMQYVQYNACSYIVRFVLHPRFMYVALSLSSFDVGGCLLPTAVASCGV